MQNVGSIPGRPDVLILRDPRESKAKCSLTPLRDREGFRFVDYRHDRRLDADGRVFLDPNGELLTPADAGRGLFLIDCSWRRVASLRRTVDGDLIPRRLPPLVTGYPRKSKTFEDPHEGLASIEALYAALWILGQADEGLLANYRWAQSFLDENRERLSGSSSADAGSPHRDHSSPA